MILWHSGNAFASSLTAGLNSWDMWWTIVGVVKDIKYHSTNERPESFLYFPLLQDTGPDANILIRRAGDPMGLLGTVQSEVHSNLNALLFVSLFAYRVAATLAAILAGFGLLLASVGLYGVLSYSVSQRTHEIGVRMALGARPEDLLRLVVGQGMRLTATGTLIGVAAALAAMRGISTLLYGVTATDARRESIRWVD